jgi:hypothetical protein
MGEPNWIARKPGGLHTSVHRGLAVPINFVVNRLGGATKALVHQPDALSIWFIKSIDKKGVAA